MRQVSLFPHLETVDSAALRLGPCTFLGAGGTFSGTALEDSPWGEVSGEVSGEVWGKFRERLGNFFPRGGCP